jgi:hypothetical protein
MTRRKLLNEGNKRPLYAQIAHGLMRIDIQFRGGTPHEPEVPSRGQKQIDLVRFEHKTSTKPQGMSSAEVMMFAMINRHVGCSKSVRAVL